MKPQRERFGPSLQRRYFLTDPRVIQLTFGLWELAKHQDCQEKLRREIKETLEKVKARGDADFTASDFESMPYLVAITKVLWNHLFVLQRGRNSLSPC